ncbi:MAG: hypothetical protein IIY21_00245 [Clostridiales bacterium]|nr:hypothetical protein [Clostridiales bacterium]MBQ1570972.1 hypothetical protein [Clostridiales bacterium]
MEQEKSSSRSSDGIICEIPMKLPSLNDYIRACRTNKFEGARMKREIENDIGFFIAKLPKFEHPITIDFLWIEENGKRDFDNIAAGKKFILDAMVKMGKLKDDNRKCVTAFRDNFAYDKEAKVILTIREVDDE